ncbi:TonB family protein [Massilia sp. DD77]|uniref:TonB family protein n=1 Tax=Massilia sp. DD77 TaxID=3109349 RepID=UPI002FFD763E
MKSKAVLSLSLALLGAQQSAAAQATVPVWRELVIYPADGAYPAELARRGVQGEALVEVTLDEQGRRATLVRSSSRSAELDTLAARIAERSDAATPVSGARSGLVKILFRKDHASTVAAKTCADFNVDAAYQAAVFPERDIRGMPVMVESISKLIYALHRDGKGRSFPGMGPVLDATVAACARNPGDGMLDVMRREALKLLEK